MVPLAFLRNQARTASLAPPLSADHGAVLRHGLPAALRAGLHGDDTYSDSQCAALAFLLPIDICVAYPRRLAHSFELADALGVTHSRRRVPLTLELADAVENSGPHVNVAAGNHDRPRHRDLPVQRPWHGRRHL